MINKTRPILSAIALTLLMTGFTAAVGRAEETVLKVVPQQDLKILDGTIAPEGGRLTGSRAGEVLRRNAGSAF